MKLIAIILLLCASLAIGSPPDQAPAVAYVYRATVVRVTDGDTADFLISLGFDVWIKQRVRLLNVYAAEKKEANGPAHQKALEALLPAGSTCTIRTTKDSTDKYGRILGEVWTAQGFVNAAMREAIKTPQGSGVKPGNIR